jgi:hypothetical protein
VSPAAATSDVDALFRLPLAEFTSARNALVAQLKRDGRQAEASEIKALPKPSASAWVVNQLYWRHREVFGRLIESGERLRRAHAAQLTGEAVRDPVNARRDVMAELARIAAGLLREGSHNATRDLMRRVTSTLEALSSYGSLPGAPVAGRLTDDLEPPGFEAVAGLLPESEKRPARADQIQMRLPHASPASKPTDTAARGHEAQRKSLIAAARASAREAERDLNVARKQAERAAAKVEPAAKRARELESQRAKIEKQLARMSLDAKAAQAHANEAAADANEARQAAEKAESALELARQRLQRLTANEDVA